MRYRKAPRGFTASSGDKASELTFSHAWRVAAVDPHTVIAADGIPESANRCGLTLAIPPTEGRSDASL